MYESIQNIPFLDGEKPSQGKNYKEDDCQQPYYKFVKTRRIYFKGKELYELKMTQYWFVNQNLPLFNALPYHMMLSQYQKDDRKNSASNADDNGLNDGLSSEPTKLVACGRK